MSDFLIIVGAITVLLLLAGFTWLLFRNSKSPIINKFFDAVMNLLNWLTGSMRDRGGRNV